MAVIPQSLRYLLKAPYLAVLCTVSPAGMPQATPIWFKYLEDTEQVLFTTVKGREKHRNIEQNPHVAFCWYDPANQFHHLSIKGRVIEVRHDPENALIHELARNYTSQPRYMHIEAGEERVIVVCRIASVAAMEYPSE